MTLTDDITQTTTHTPEPWGDNQNGIILGNLDEYAGVAPIVAVVEGYDEDGNANDEATANTRRICAAVNACEGITTEALEQGIVAELLANLKTLLEQIDEDVPTDTTTRHFSNAYDEALATLAKATGRAV